jgi:hypothetical protein
MLANLPLSGSPLEFPGTSETPLDRRAATVSYSSYELLMAAKHVWQAVAIVCSQCACMEKIVLN